MEVKEVGSDLAKLTELFRMLRTKPTVSFSANNVTKPDHVVSEKRKIAENHVCTQLELL